MTDRENPMNDLSRLSAWPCGACGVDVNAGQLTSRQKTTPDPAIGAWEVRDGKPGVIHDRDRCRRAQR